jgi:hypothetical protein
LQAIEKHRGSPVLGNTPLAAICTAGFMLTTVTYYPGLMTPDSDSQLRQAQKIFFTDWHPPIMSLVWSALLKIHDGPVGMLVLFGLGYWGSFWIMCRALAVRSRLAAYVLAASAFTPMMINFAGTIWKDVFLAVGFLAVCATVVDAHCHAKMMRRSTAAGLIVIIATSVCARRNAIFAGAALATLVLCHTFDLRHRGQPSLIKACLLGGSLYVVALGITHAAINAVTHPKKTQPSSQLFLYDLVGMSVRTNQWLLPPSASFTLADLRPCYKDNGWDLIWLKCPRLIDELRKSGEWKRLRGRWVKAIASHPRAYATHRLAFFLSWFREADEQHLFVEPTQKSYEYGFTQRPAFTLMKAYVEGAARLPPLRMLFTNNFWLLLNLLMTTAYSIYFLVRRQDEVFLPLFISLSGMLYTAPLIFGGVAPDFRYIYWGIATAFVSMAISIANRWPDNPHLLIQHEQIIH